jgi:hypothetical protein
VINGVVPKIAQVASPKISTNVLAISAMHARIAFNKRKATALAKMRSGKKAKTT